MKFAIKLLAMLVIVLTFGANSSLAQSQGKSCSTEVIDCVSGGIGQSEREALLNQSSKYNFWLTTAGSKSGAYLSEVQVTIRDVRSGARVFFNTMDGPWLFANLPPGNYEVEARYRENDTAPVQVVKKITSIQKGQHRQMMLYFNVASESD
ncbi:MAG: carboxypeptidase regulatory-like domain-containing protein [Burkholderiales bacterium]|nr:carboxypeptidase regulatory-like domain-containing protein [Burkholderiales bacterium]